MKNLTLLFVLFSFAVQAQVGIGTTTPRATLDITGEPAISTELDGIIAPRLTGGKQRLWYMLRLQILLLPGKPLM